MKIFDRWTKKNKEKEREKSKESAVDKSDLAQKSQAAVKETVKTTAAVHLQKFHPAGRFLLKPLVTEKSTYRQSEGQYCFIVQPAANKVEVKKAIEAIYNVQVRKVRMMNYQGKTVRYGRILGQRKNWKKAMITLKPGEKIEIHKNV